MADKVSLKNLPLYLSGFGQAESLSIETPDYTSGTKATQALLSNEVDFALLQVEHVLRDTSGQLRILSLVTHYPGAAIIVDSKYKDQIKTVADLAGRKVGVSSLGAASHQFSLALLSKHQVDEKFVQFLPVGLNAPEVLPQGQVEAMYTIEPFLTQALDSGLAYALVDARRSEGTQAVYGADTWPWIALVTRTDVLESKPEAVSKMVSAMRNSLSRLTSDTIPSLVDLTPAEIYPNGDKALFTRILEANRGQYSPGGQLTQSMLEPVWVSMQQLGVVPANKPLPYDQFAAANYASGVK